MSMVNRMRLVGVTVCLATIALSVPAEAGPILRVKNTSSLVATLSDLIAYGEADQKKTILKLNEASDDIVMSADEMRLFDAGFEVKEYFISKTATGIGEFETGVFEVKQTKPTKLGFVRDPNQLVDLFAFIDFDLALPPPPEGTLLSFVDGQNPAVPGWFVGTVVDFDNGTVSGAYDGVGQILAGFEVEAIAAIPEPSTFILFGAGAAAFGAYRWRHSRRKTASPPTSATDWRLSVRSAQI